MNLVPTTIVFEFFFQDSNFPFSFFVGCCEEYEITLISNRHGDFISHVSIVRSLSILHIVHDYTV
jgi:hypothetical protein